jgi:hypothetical protein
VLLTFDIVAPPVALGAGWASSEKHSPAIEKTVVATKTPVTKTIFTFCI